MGRHAGWFLLLAPLVVACSTGRGRYAVDRGAPTPDAVDAAVPPDVVQLPLDRGGQEDAPPTGCDPMCTAQGTYLCTSSSATGNLCVECLTDQHCVDNPGAAGMTCDTTSFICSCASDADCVGKTLGPRCHANDKICSCLTDSDCGGGWRCIGYFFGVKVCKPPCASDADCAGNMFEKVCDPQTGCQECVNTSQCGPTTLGSTCVDGLCSCSADADCAGNLNGNKCLTDATLCGCENDLDCPGGTACTGQYAGNRLCR